MDALSSLCVCVHVVLCAKPPLQNQHVRTWGNSRNFDLSGCWRQATVYTRCRSHTFCTVAPPKEVFKTKSCRTERAPSTIRESYRTGYASTFDSGPQLSSTWWTAIIYNKICCQIVYLYIHCKSEFQLVYHEPLQLNCLRNIHQAIRWSISGPDFTTKVPVCACRWTPIYIGTVKVFQWQGQGKRTT